LYADARAAYNAMAALYRDKPILSFPSTLTGWRRDWSALPGHKSRVLQNGRMPDVAGPCFRA